MDTHEAANILSVADHEVIDVRQHAGWWEAHHHDMASHEETWRRVGPADLSEDDDEAVPDGTAAQVLAWVGDDAVRAARAAEVERAGKARGTLLVALDKLAG